MPRVVSARFLRELAISRPVADGEFEFAAFAKLSQLDLSRCLLDERGQKLATQLAKRVNLERQRNWSDHAEDPEYRYAAVGE